MKTYLWSGALIAMLALCFGAPGPVRAQQAGSDRFGDDDRFESEFYGDLQRSSSASSSTDASRSSQAAARSSASAASAGQTIEQQASVPREFIPWSNTSWPFLQAELAFRSFSDGLSPLEKYDSIVASLYGRLPGAAAWEADPVNHHNASPLSTKIGWGGHCNGWAAASILQPEPTRSFQVPLGDKPVAYKLNISSASAAKPYLFSDGDGDYRKVNLPGRVLTLTSADMKGLLSETYETSKTQQFTSRRITGTRYDRSQIDLSDEAFRDIEPHYFHWLLQEFVKKKGWAIVAEVNANSVVNNHPLYKYETKAVFNAARRSYDVTTKCYMADYSTTPTFVGTNVLVKTYTYRLFNDASGRVTRGEWTGKSVTEHPDFVWIPTGDIPPAGTFENAAVNGDFVRWIYESYGQKQ